MYQELYNLIVTTIYNGSVTGEQQLVATFIATCGIIFLVALPFCLVYKVIQVISGGRV